MRAKGLRALNGMYNGKIKSITRVNGFSKTVNSVVTYPPDLEFGYDAMGQRVLKIVKTRDAAGLKPQADWKYTYYVRDAAGNVLTTYNRTITVDQTNAAHRIDKYKVDEWTMYGAGRLGVQEPSGEGVTAAELKFEPEQNTVITVISRTATAVPTTSLLRKAGEKIYELASHLGNVLVTVTDRLLPVQNPNALAQTLYYSADVKSATDYSAFGAPLGGRSVSSNAYRYSMNGQEKDEELGSGVTTAEFWEYDAKLARRWNVDPKDNPSISVYACFENNPIVFNDILGDTVRGANKKSADNTLLILQNTFSYSRHEKLRALFKLGQDGKTFMSISQSDFENAIAGLSDDEKALAYGYFIAINSTSVHTVETVNRDDKLLTERMVEGKLAKTGEDIDKFASGGLNIANKFMSYSIIVMDSKASVTYVSSKETKNEASSPGELLAHSCPK
jgi:RHS repeat-associated protein